MKEIKALMFDIDDTLYSHKINSIPQKTLDALQKLKATGYPMAISTSRTYYELDYFPKEMFDMFDYIFSGTGTIIHQKDIVLEAVTMPKGLVREFIDYFDNNNITYAWAGKKGVMHFSEKLSEEKRSHVIKYTSKEPIIEKWNNDDTIMLTFYNVNEVQLRDIKSLSPFANVTAWHTSGQISPLGIDKSYGLKRFSQFIDIPVEQICAFGDGANDISMITSAGFGIAVGNSNEELMKQANYISDTIENGGIMEACVHLQLIKENN